MTQLTELIANKGIKQGNIDYDRYRDQKPSHEELLKLMLELNTHLDGKMIVIGGQTLNPELLGHRSMRRPSNDIDTIVTEEGVQKLESAFGNNEHFFYYPEHDELFLEYAGLPVGFSIGKIHDWKIPQDFYKSTISFVFPQSAVTVASPEYTMMLKLRRAYSEQRLFGKDKVDITNLLLASYFRPTTTTIDMPKVAGLIHEHITSNHSEIQPYIEELARAKENLKKNERQPFSENYEKLNTAITQQYAPTQQI